MTCQHGHLSVQRPTCRYAVEREHRRVGGSVELFASGQWFNRRGPNSGIAWRVSGLTNSDG